MLSLHFWHTASLIEDGFAPAISMADTRVTVGLSPQHSHMHRNIAKYVPPGSGSLAWG